MKSIRFVYQRLDEPQRSAVIALWTQAGVLPMAEAVRRVDEISALILDGQALIGVSTAYLHPLAGTDTPYFHLRSFILPQHRGCNATRKQLMQTNFTGLREHASQAQGLVIELENPKLARLGANTNYLHRRGYRYHGQSPRGLPLWYVRFDQAEGIFRDL